MRKTEQPAAEPLPVNVTVMSPADESKREKFLRLGDARMSRALTALRLVGQLGNKGAYEYTGDDVDKMLAALNEAVAEVGRRMRPKAQASFTFR